MAQKHRSRPDEGRLGCDRLPGTSLTLPNLLQPRTQFSDHRKAALALLNGSYRLTRKAGQFLGQLAVDPTPTSDAQTAWLDRLLAKHGLAPLVRDLVQ